jgi:phosphatidylglycerol:prolipoprotein diacylglycerol transferase
MPFPNFNPVLLHIGFVSIRWYALAYIAGILLGWFYCTRLIANADIWTAPSRPAIQPPVDSRQIDDLVLWLTLGVILGGRLGFVLFYGRDQYTTHPLEILKIWNGGMSFHGGFIGVMIAIIAYSLINKINVLRLGDLVAPCVPFGLFFGRIANFINGELWGRPTTLPWGIVFCSPNIMKLNNGECPAGLDPRHPSQLYEAGLEGLALFLILRWATHRARWLPREGALTGLFMMAYGVFRIALENVRQPDQGLDHLPGGLTMGIILSTPMVLIGGVLILRSRRTPPPIKTPPAEDLAAEPPAA